MHVGCGVVFVSRALCSEFVAVAIVVVAMHPTILGCFIDPEVVGDFLAVESAGAVGAPRWLVGPPVPIVVVITTVLAAPVVIFVVVTVLLSALLLPLLPWLRHVHFQLLL